MKSSSFLSLSIKDFGKGLLMAVLGAVLGLVYGSVQAGNFTFDWKSIWQAALAAAVAYVIKNFFTNSSGQFMSTEKK